MSLTDVSLTEVSLTEVAPEIDRPELGSLHRDDCGQMVVEWVLVTAVVILPLALMIPGLVNMIRIYFYRIAGVIGLPFP